MKILTILGLALIISHQAFSQKDTTTLRGTTAFVSLLGSIKYPGIKAGLEYPVVLKDITRISSDGEARHIHKQRSITAQLGSYYQKDYNTNIFFQGGYKLQRMNSKGWFTHFEPQVGVSRTILDATVYTVEDDGSVKHKRAAGRFYIAPALAFGVGKDFSNAGKKLPVTAFARLTLFANTPYNRFIYLRPMIEAGVSYELMNLAPHAVKTKTVTKSRNK